MALLRSSFKIGILLVFLRLLTAIADTPVKEAPCNYMETVSLDPSKRLPNGSYLYDSIIVPANQTGIYDYKILVGEVITPADLHVRGCICNIRPCISICCPDGSWVQNETCTESDYELSSFINITTKQGNTVSVDIFHQFALQYYRPCDGLYNLQPEFYEFDNYTILEDGSLVRFFDGISSAKGTYCLSPTHTIQNSLFTYGPMLCYSNNIDDPTYARTNGVALLISVPFMILTIIVYLVLPDLRTIHGLSFCCYLAGISVGYSMLAYIIFKPNMSGLECSVSGYIAYFGFMSGFFWLSAISFDLYSNVHGSGSHQKMKQFRLYCAYAWGLALICLICTYIAHNTSYIPKSWKTGMGVEYCFIENTGWSALLYLYGPIILIVSFNIVMFVLTFIQIRKRMQLAAFNGTHKPHHEHKALFMAFLRLFIIMGITWLAEILGYLTPRDSWFHNIFRITDFLNGIQGLIIFILFVCRKSVRNLILKKFGTRDGMSVDQTQEMTQCL